MQHIAPEVIAIADACLGGLHGRSALLIGPEEQRYPYLNLLKRAGMKYIYQEDNPMYISHLLPNVQLLISLPTPATVTTLTAASVARGCNGRHTPLLIFDLAHPASVDELAGLLPAVCLYTSDDLRHILSKTAMKAS